MVTGEVGGRAGRLTTDHERYRDGTLRSQLAARVQDRRAFRQARGRGVFSRRRQRSLASPVGNSPVAVERGQISAVVGAQQIDAPRRNWKRQLVLTIE